MDLDSKIQANTQGFFVLTFFNEREKSLTERTIHYIFSKFGQVSEIKYAEHGPVFISYKEKEEALKALEIMNMGTKYHVEIDWQPVKKNETTESTKSEGKDSFLYLRIPPKWNKGLTAYVSIELFGFKEPGAPNTKNFVFSWHFKGHMKIVFDSKRARDEIMEKHQKNPFKWPKGVGGDFEFFDDVPSVKGENSFIYLHMAPKFKGSLASYVTDRLSVFTEASDIGTPFHFEFSWLYKGYMKIVFDSKRVKNEIMEKHQKNPLKWPKGVGGDFEFLDDLPIAYIRRPSFYVPYLARPLKFILFGNFNEKTKIRSIEYSKCGKLLMVVFYANITKDEVMKAHNKKPFVWQGRENMEALEFLNYFEALALFGKKKEN